MTAEHWQSVYRTKDEDEVSWFEPSAAVSLEMIQANLAAVDVGAGHSPEVDHRAAVDVGAGRSMLAIELLARGWHPVIALDISTAALEHLHSRAEAAGLADDLQCITSDVLTWQPVLRVKLWHDRAVFHFLTDPADQAHYADLAARTVLPGGLLIVATFAPDGPEQCSGLPTARHDAESLQRAFAPDFELVDHRRQEHRTPWGAVQPFTWVAFGRR
ncbi:MAG: methyltransferase domain-containing protein [Actinomycetales bacterium]